MGSEMCIRDSDMSLQSYHVNTHPTLGFLLYHRLNKARVIPHGALRFRVPVKGTLIILSQRNKRDGRCQQVSSEAPWAIHKPPSRDGDVKTKGFDGRRERLFCNYDYPSVTTKS